MLLNVRPPDRAGALSARSLVLGALGRKSGSLRSEFDARAALSRMRQPCVFWGRHGARITKHRDPGFVVLC